MFEVLIDRVEIVKEDKSFLEAKNLKVKKVNKIRSIFGFITLYQPFGNNLIIEAKTLKKQGGEYRYLPYKVPPTPLCDLIIKDKYIYPDFARQSDFSEDPVNNCPIIPVSLELF